VAVASPSALEVVDLLIEVEKARQHPADLLRWVTCVDSKSGDTFEFQLLDKENGWYWQREVLDEWLRNEKWVGLKARQLGITWLAAGYGLWKGLTSPGSTILVISTNEEEASKVINRIWDMYESLPPRFKFDVKVISPTRGARPFTKIAFQHLDGKVSRFIGLPATKKSGHGETAAVVILDEFARQEYAGEIWKGVLPTMADGGKIIVISTANGVSNEQTGEGNFFHHIWKRSDAQDATNEYGIKSRFMPWSNNPDRDQEWYDALALKPRDKAEQYPNDADEAFILTGDVYFDVESLAWYKKNALEEEKYRCEFKKLSKATATLHKSPEACIRVFEEPVVGRAYAIAADVATGRGADYSAAYVIDLSNMEFAAELHGKIDVDLYAYQLHYLGRWYQSAILAVEMGGGWGEPVVISLRDGKDGRPSYPKLYRHRERDRADIPEKVTYGFPMTLKTRPQVINQLEAAIREKSLPFLPGSLFRECQTFVYRDTSPSPRAQEGCNDDRVFAAAIALELYRQYGAHPDKHRYKRRGAKRPWYPWENA
jgi:hypothetical protein